MSDEFLVKGATILSKYKFVEDHFDADLYNQFRIKLREKNIPMVFTAGWYPFSVYNQVLEQIVTDFFRGNTKKLERVGEYSAESSLKYVYKNFLKEEGFMSFLLCSPTLHSIFYSKGELRVEPGIDNRSCRLLVTNQPVVTKEDTYVTCGFYRQAAELHGVKNLKYNIHTGNGVVTHVLSWQ